MNNALLLLIGLVLIAGCSSPPPLSTPSPTPSVTPSAPSGRQAFQSRDGSLTCVFPPGSESLFIPDRGEPGAYKTLFRGKGGNQYQVAWRLCEEPKGTPVSFKRLIEEIPRGSKISGQKDFEQDGHKGIEIRFEAQDGPTPSSGVFRALAGNHRIFMAMSIVETGKPSAESDTFMASFKPNLDRAPQDDPPLSWDWKEVKAGDGSFTCTLPAEFTLVADKDGYHGTCMVPTRFIHINCRPGKENIDQVRTIIANLKSITNITGCKEIERDGAKGFELVDLGSSHRKDLVSYSLVLLKNGRKYEVMASGLKGDSHLEADARKVLDSFKLTSN